MAIATWSDLCAAIADFMNRQDATVAIPSFVTLAEAEMNRKLRVRQMTGRAAAVISSEFESVPADYCGEQAMTLDGNPGCPPVIQLEFADADKINFEKANHSVTVGQPSLYSVQGSDLQFWPPPDGPYMARAVYYQVIPALSASRATNWLLTKYPDAYLYGSLSNAGNWLRGEPRLSDWINEFEGILANIQDINKIEADAPRLEMPSRLVV